MNKIKQTFENIWKIKILCKEFKEKDKEKFYNFFMDGYTCALINLEDIKGEKDVQK